MDALAHCLSLVQARDEDRWLAARYAPPPTRDRLTALYALQSELRRVPGMVSEAPLGEIRLQWHRDALAEIRVGAEVRRHPIVEAVAQTGLAAAEFQDGLDAAIDAAARPLYAEGFSGSADLMSWLEEAEGAFDAMAIAAVSGDEDLSSAARRAGAAFAAAREGRRLAPNCWDETKAAALNLWRREAPTLRAAPAGCAPALAHLFLTPLYLKRGERPFPLAKRLRIFSVVAFGK